MKIEVGKKYKGLIYEVYFKVISEQKKAKGIYCIIQFEDGIKRGYYKDFLEHLQIDEV
jgi:hypothetical protein